MPGTPEVLLFYYRGNPGGEQCRHLEAHTALRTYMSRVHRRRAHPSWRAGTNSSSLQWLSVSEGQPPLLSSGVWSQPSDLTGLTLPLRGGGTLLKPRGLCLHSALGSSLIQSWASKCCSALTPIFPSPSWTYPLPPDFMFKPPPYVSLWGTKVS